MNGSVFLGKYQQFVIRFWPGSKGEERATCPHELLKVLLIVSLPSLEACKQRLHNSVEESLLLGKRIN